MVRILKHGIVILFFTALTQIGGVLWLISLYFRRSLMMFCLLYVGVTASLQFWSIVPGRVALPCVSAGPMQLQSWFYCATNRNFVTPELEEVLHDTADRIEQTFPGTKTLVLDANFPFFLGFPLPPHLSHNDGEKADLALFYKDADGLVSGKTRSPVGYFAFEQGPTDCPDHRFTMRWDLNFLQPLWRDFMLDENRTGYALRVLQSDPRVGKVFIEPHLQLRLGVSGGNVRFQGCRAARHDDHIHLQL